jgi:hypothetical protein
VCTIPIHHASRAGNLLVMPALQLSWQHPNLQNPETKNKCLKQIFSNISLFAGISLKLL